MKKIPTIAIALTLFTSAPIAFACDYPTRADLPDGATASKDDMLAGQRSVKDYMVTMEEYLSCIEKVEKDAVAATPEVSEEDRAARDAAFTKKYNAAVEEMELIAARFNEEVRAYKNQSE